MIVGQVILLLPLYFLPARLVFYTLILLIIVALTMFPMQDTRTGFIAALCMGGFGCSAVFPILISMIEKELFQFAKGSRLYPFFETACSVMMAGYFIGVGTNDLWSEKATSLSESLISNHFLNAIIFIVSVGLIAIYLILTRNKKEQRNQH
jgi:hypothetical protein